MGWARPGMRGALRFACAALMLAGLGQAQQPGAPDGSPPPQQGSGPAQGGHRGQYAGMARVAGEVTAVNGATLTVRSAEGGDVQIVTTDNTRVMKANGVVKVSDLHVGDGVMAVGNSDPATHALHAGMIMAEDAAEVKAMRENMGKTYITGRVTAVNLDDAKMTVERPDHVAQTIGFDESTSFKRAVRPQRPAGGEGAAQAPGQSAAGGNAGGGNAGGGGGRGFRGGGGGFGMMGDPTASVDRAFQTGESITLADIKVGDFVMGTGAVKSGTFVPVKLLDSPPRQHRQAGGGPPAAGTQPGDGQGAGPGAGSPGPGGF